MYESVKAPRFEVGGHVVALTPTNPHRGKEGIVVQVIESAGDTVYRYVVRFDDGSTATLFSFELQLSA